jgi:hypothetical protein
MLAPRLAAIPDIRLLVVFIAILFSGCLDAPESRSEERLRVTIIGTPDSEEWSLGIPVPTSTPGTSPLAWLANLTNQGHPEISLVETKHGTVLRVNGTGTVVVSSYAIQGPMLGNMCCAEAYLNAHWSAGERNHTYVRVASWLGEPYISITYEATSPSCGREDVALGDLNATRFEGEAPRWFWLAATKAAWCE